MLPTQAPARWFSAGLASYARAASEVLGSDCQELLKNKQSLFALACGYICIMRMHAWCWCKSNFDSNALTRSSAMGKGKRPSAVPPEIAWQVGLLAKEWENDDVIRARARNSQALTRWPSAKTKGVPSLRAIQLNADSLLHLARRWCPLVETAKSPPIPLIRAEAGSS